MSQEKSTDETTCFFNSTIENGDKVKIENDRCGGGFRKGAELKYWQTTQQCCNSDYGIVCEFPGETPCSGSGKPTSNVKHFCLAAVDSGVSSYTSCMDSDITIYGNQYPNLISDGNKNRAKVVYSDSTEQSNTLNAFVKCPSVVLNNTLSIPWDEGGTCKIKPV